MNVVVVRFPGSNCDQDCFNALELIGARPRYVWHKDQELGDADLVILPGGFSFGDYLRCGAIARFSPIMGAVKAFAAKGGLVCGICNGFQILCESGLLPGALVRNRDLHFICEPVWLRVETIDSPITRLCATGQVLEIPIAHGEGSYQADAETLARLEGEGRVLFRYCDRDGNLSDAVNPNGSAAHIAGICNAGRNVIGMMPHPERAVEPGLGSSDGRRLLESLLQPSTSQPALAAQQENL